MKLSKKIFSLTLALMLIFTTAFSVPTEAASVTISKVTTCDPLTGSTKSINIAKGKTIKLTTTVNAKPNKAPYKKVSYKTLNSKIATVSGKGVIKGIKPGKTKIIVTSSKNPKKKATINVTVKKTAVTGVSLSKPSSTNIYVGDSISLKAKALGKKTAYKKLSWKSSNSKLATVSKNGTVNALKTGTVNISAYAVDGSKKKATITLNIINKPVQNPIPKNEPVNILSVSVQNEKTISFKLSKAKVLSKNDIKIYTKALYNGTYRGTLEFEEIKTSDNINYSINLDSYSFVKGSYFVKVSIPSLDGTKEAETQYNEAVTAYEDEYIVKLTLNQPLSNYSGYSRDFGLSFEQAIGLTSHTLTGLPAGITYKIQNNMILLYGKPTTPGIFVSTYKAIDELGNTITKKIKFIIASDTTLYATSKTVYGNSHSEQSITASITAYGGSGSYKYTFAPNSNTYSCSIHSNQVYGHFEKPGTYTIPIVVTDYANPTLTTTTNVTFIISQGITMAGIVKDFDGNPIPNAKVSVQNTNKADKATARSSYTTDKSGSYTFNLSPGTYNIVVSYSNGTSDNASAIKYFYSQNIKESKSGYDFTLPVYKVVFNLPTSASSSSFSGSWSDSNGYTYGSGTYIYVKPGTYNLESPFANHLWYSSEHTKSIKSSFTVTNKSVTANTTTVKDSSDLKITGIIDLNSNNDISGKITTDPYYAIYSLKPTNNCDVQYTDKRAANDIYIDVYDITAETMIGSYDDSKTISLNKDHEYYIRVRALAQNYSSFSYSFSFNVKTDSE